MIHRREVRLYLKERNNHRGFYTKHASECYSKASCSQFSINTYRKSHLPFNYFSLAFSEYIYVFPACFVPKNEDGMQTVSRDPCLEIQVSLKKQRECDIKQR